MKIDRRDGGGKISEISQYKKNKIYQLRLERYSIRKIAKKVNVSPTIVQKYVKIFESTPPKFTDKPFPPYKKIKPLLSKPLFELPNLNNLQQEENYILSEVKEKIIKEIKENYFNPIFKELNEKLEADRKLNEQYLLKIEDQEREIQQIKQQKMKESIQTCNQSHIYYLIQTLDDMNKKKEIWQSEIKVCIRIIQEKDDTMKKLINHIKENNIFSNIYSTPQTINNGKQKLDFQLEQKNTLTPKFVTKTIITNESYKIPFYKDPYFWKSIIDSAKKIFPRLDPSQQKIGLNLTI